MYAIRQSLRNIDQCQRAGLLGCLVKRSTSAITRTTDFVCRSTMLSAQFSGSAFQHSEAAPMSVSAKNASTDFSTNTKEALTLMHNQTKFYAIVEIKNRPYHVAKNDVIIVPRMNDLQIGDVITLDRVREMGSPDYIMQGNPYLDPRYYTIQATAIEHTVGKAIERKHRKRSGISKYVRMTSSYTLLRVCEMDVVDSR
ncbi:hypothetical protein MT418_002169 [Batrachochytrium dendrobatidis]